MAEPAARIPERGPCDGNELPRIAAVVERQLQHLKAGVVPHLAVGDRRPEGIPLLFAAGVGHPTHARGQDSKNTYNARRYIQSRSFAARRR